VGPRQYRRRKSAGGGSTPPAAVVRIVRGGWSLTRVVAAAWNQIRSWSRDGSRIVVDGPEIPIDRNPARGGDESGWSSRSAVRTGRLRRSPVVHSRPIDLVVFQEPSHHNGAGNLVLKRASRLDAFSAYPFPTWLPDDAPSGTAGTPEVGPPQSSRTRGDPSQVSYAHGR
jgi:hypothetical protein